MKIIYNEFIPFKNFIAINLFGILFVRKEYKDRGLGKNIINHEEIHTAQIKEMGYVFFYIWYAVEWIVRLCIDYRTAYRNISFEKEAYSNEYNLHYLEGRRHYSWIKYLK